MSNLENIIAKITAKPSKIQINCPNETNFRSVQPFLLTNKTKINFHTYHLLHQRLLKIVIKDLLHDISDEEITSELELLGYTPKHIRAFIKNGRKMPIHMIALSDYKSAKEIYNLKCLFYTNVKVESYKSSRPAQCYACQLFGHSSLQCEHFPRCVKCGADHQTSICIRSKEETPKCCNYLGEHIANFRGCSFYIDLVKEKVAQTRNLRTHTKQDKQATLTTMPVITSDTAYQNQIKPTFGEVTKI